MPTYVYKFVKTGETIEVEQSFADDALTQAVNPRTGRKMAVKKVFTPVGVTFRGDGFYKTDSRSSTSRKGGASSDTPASTSDSKSSTSDSSTSSSSDSKSASSDSKSTSSDPKPSTGDSKSSTSASTSTPTPS